MSTPPQTTADMREIDRPAADRVATPPGMPDVPGGWAERSWQIEGRTLRFWLPADPDAFLEDPAVHQAHEQDGYMPYWAYVWPASLKMAAAVLRHTWAAGATAVELGAGVGIVGLAGLHAGLAVTLTDYDPVAVQLCVHNAQRQGFPQAQGAVLDWRQPLSIQPDVLLACEVLYEDRNHEMLLGVLDAMLPPHGVAWFGDGGRVRAERFCAMLAPRGFEYRLYDEYQQPLTQLRAGQYQLIEIRRRA